MRLNLYKSEHLASHNQRGVTFHEQSAYQDRLLTQTTSRIAMTDIENISIRSEKENPVSPYKTDGVELWVGPSYVPRTRRPKANF